MVFKLGGSMKGKLTLDNEMCGVTEELEADSIKGLQSKSEEYIKKVFDAPDDFTGQWEVADGTWFLNSNYRLEVELEVL